MTDSGRMAYTVAICTHNQAERLRRTLEDLATVKSPSAPWELLIVDNASTDGTPSLLQSNQWRKPEWQVRTVVEDRLGVAHARNSAIRQAHGEYIVFLDDDETPESDWLVAYERVIEQYQPDAMGGRIEVMFEDGKRPAWLTDELMGFLGKLDYGDERFRFEDAGTPIFTGNCAFRRRIFEKAAMFDGSLGRKGRVNTGGEDTAMYRHLLSSGFHIRWVPDGVVHHRIQTEKLRRAYFIELHYHMGFSQGAIKRGSGSRIPPAYLAPQLWRACVSAVRQRFRHGGDMSLRREMNVGYFIGYINGWLRGRVNVDADPVGGIS